MSILSYESIYSESALAEAKRVWGRLSPEAVTEHAKLRWPGGIAERAARRMLLRSTFDLLTGCAEWNGPLRPDGYCEFWVGDRVLLGHRAVWALFVQPLDQLILHKCDNPRCLNPTHLFPGSDKDNQMDKMLKGRALKKLAPAEVIEIRQCYRRGKPGTTTPQTLTGLSRRFNVSKQQIWKIVRGRDWSWLENHQPQKERTDSCQY